MIEIEVFKDENGKSPFEKWYFKLDKKSQQIVAARLERIHTTDNFGDFKHITQGVYELRIFYSSGYRIYYGKHGNKMIILLTGGDKSTQGKDIKKAEECWRKYVEEKYN